MIECFRIMSKMEFTDKDRFDQSVSLLHSVWLSCTDLALKNLLHKFCMALCRRDEFSTFDFSRYVPLLVMLHAYSQDTAQNADIFDMSSPNHGQVVSKYRDRTLALYRFLMSAGFFSSFEPSLLSETAMEAWKNLKLFCFDHQHSQQHAPMPSRGTFPNAYDVMSVLRSLNCTFACLEDLCTSAVPMACPTAAMKKALALQTMYPTQPISSSALSSFPDINRYNAVYNLVRSFWKNLESASFSPSRKQSLKNFINRLLNPTFVSEKQLPDSLKHFLTHSHAAGFRRITPVRSDHFIGPPGSGIFVTVRSVQLFENDQNAYERFRVSACLYRSIEHPCIVMLRAVHWPLSEFDASSNSPWPRYAHVITERMWSSLLDVFSSPLLSIRINRLIILWDVLSAIIALHQVNICHTAINPRNVWLRFKGRRLYGHVKLDLPFLTDTIVNCQDPNSLTLDAILCRPPENLRYNGGDHLTSDVWSYGVLFCLLHLFGGRPAFREETLAFITRFGCMRYIQTLPDRINDVSLQSILRRCFHNNPADRITSFQLKEVLDSHLKISDEISAFDNSYRQGTADPSGIDLLSENPNCPGFDSNSLEALFDPARPYSASNLPTQNVKNVTHASPLNAQAQNITTLRDPRQAYAYNTNPPQPSPRLPPRVVPLQNVQSTYVPTSAVVGGNEFASSNMSPHGISGNTRPTQPALSHQPLIGPQQYFQSTRAETAMVSSENVPVLMSQPSHGIANNAHPVRPALPHQRSHTVSQQHMQPTNASSPGVVGGKESALLYHSSRECLSNTHPVQPPLSHPNPHVGPSRLLQSTHGLNVVDRGKESTLANRSSGGSPSNMHSVQPEILRPPPRIKPRKHPHSTNLVVTSGVNIRNGPALVNSSHSGNFGMVPEVDLREIAEVGASNAAKQVEPTKDKINVKMEDVCRTSSDEIVPMTKVPFPKANIVSRNAEQPTAQNTIKEYVNKDGPTVKAEDAVGNSSTPRSSGRRLKRRAFLDDSDDSVDSGDFNDSSPSSAQRNHRSGKGDHSVVASDTSDVRKEQKNSDRNRSRRKSRTVPVNYAEPSSEEDNEILSSLDEDEDVPTQGGEAPGNSEVPQSWDNVLMIPREVSNPTQNAPKKSRLGSTRPRADNRQSIKTDASWNSECDSPQQPQFQEEGPHTPGWTELQTGISLENGASGTRDREKAREFYEMAAGKGCQTAIIRLGNCFECGVGVTKDAERAFELYKSLAVLDNRDGLFHVGRCYEEGIGVARNLFVASEKYAKAAELGHVLSKMGAARIYEKEVPKAEGQSKAFRMYSLANKDGHLEAKVKLAECYAKGHGTRRHLQRAAELYREAANKGNASAMLAMGLLHEDGSGVKKSTELALKYYRQSAALNHAPGITAMGQCYIWGYGVAQNYVEAERLFKISSSMGHGLAFHELGIMYKDGNGVEQNYATAAAYFRSGAEKDCEVAMVQLGECYYHGKGLEKNDKEAFKCFERGAELGAQEAWRWLGDCYLDGIGVEKDVKKAVEYYRKASGLGSATALTSLASCYENGVGVAPNMNRAVSYYRRAAESGDHTAHNNLGILYEKGKHVKADASKAVHHYRKAIEYGSVEAMCNLADCYANGCGVEKDVKAAYEWYEKGAASGHAGSQCELGLCYLHGKGVAKDTMIALYFLHNAADREAEASRQLGELYTNGDVVEKNLKKAFEFFVAAADKGNFDACFDVANCFHYGYGVDCDETKAKQYYEKGMAGGNRSAKAGLGNLHFGKRDFETAFGMLKNVESEQRCTKNGTGSAGRSKESAQA